MKQAPQYWAILLYNQEYRLGPLKRCMIRKTWLEVAIQFWTGKFVPLPPHRRERNSTDAVVWEANKLTFQTDVCLASQSVIDSREDYNKTIASVRCFGCESGEIGRLPTLNEAKDQASNIERRRFWRLKLPKNPV